MDGGEKERTVVNALKEEVKENLKQRKALGPEISPLTPTAYGSYLSPESITVSSFNYAFPPLTVVLPNQNSLLQDSLPPNPISGEVGSFDPNRRRKDHESTLLMNYLDHVFPMQFNCYVPSVMELGRGW